MRKETEQKLREAFQAGYFRHGWEVGYGSPELPDEDAYIAELKTEAKEGSSDG